MAVVFISPKQRQRMFFIGITAIFLLILIIMSFGVFFSKPKAVSTALVFNKPQINIDMTIFDSDQFKNLQLFTHMQTQYSYKALTKDNKEKTGFISAASMNEARKVLESAGLAVTELKEVEIGRDNPFIPYYQPVAALSAATKTTTPTTGAKTTTKK